MRRALTFWSLVLGAVLATLCGLFRLFDAMPVQGLTTRFYSRPPSFLAQLLGPLRLLFEGHWREPFLTEFLLAMAAAGVMAGAALFLRWRRR